MNKILIFIAGVMVFILINMEIDSYNPCSQFSSHQGECSQSIED